MEFDSRPIGDALIYLATEVESEIEADFNRWTEGHLKDNLSLPGFLSARRLRRAPADSPASDQPTYLTLYDLSDLDAIEALSSPSRDRSMPEAFSGRFRFSRSLFRALETLSGLKTLPGSRTLPELRTLPGLKTPPGLKTLPGLKTPPDRQNHQLRGPAILHITVDVEPAYNEAFLDWYVGEHVPAVLSAPGMLSARRFENASVDADGHPADAGFRYLTIYEMEDPGVVGRPETIEASLGAPCPTRLEPHRRFTHQVYEEFLALEA